MHNPKKGNKIELADVSKSSEISEISEREPETFGEDGGERMPLAPGV